MCLESALKETCPNKNKDTPKMATSIQETSSN